MSSKLQLFKGPGGVTKPRMEELRQKDLSEELDNLETVKFILSPSFPIENPADGDPLDNLILTSFDLRYIMDADSPSSPDSSDSCDSLSDSKMEGNSKAEEINKNGTCVDALELKLLKNHTNQVPRPPPIPTEAFNKRVLCQILGFDNYGCLYIVFPNEENERKNIKKLNELNAFYQNFNLSYLKVNAKIKIGDILVARVLININEKVTPIFLRIQVVQNQINGDVCAYDIDQQKLRLISLNDLFYLPEHFLNFPTKATKCLLAGLPDLIGTGILVDALLASTTGKRKMWVQVMEMDGANLPLVGVYYEDQKWVSDVWGFNNELMKVLGNWNKEPLNLEKDMVLPKVKITCASQCGFVWVQLQSKLMKVLSDMKPDKEKMSFAQPGHILNTVTASWEKGKCSFVKKWKDGTYRRVIIIGLEGDDPAKKEAKRSNFEFVKETPPRVVILYTDYGIKKACSLNELFPFSYFCDILENIPAQCFEAVLKPFEGKNSILLHDSDRIVLVNSKDVQVVICDTWKRDIGRPEIVVFFPEKGIIYNSLDSENSSRASPESDGFSLSDSSTKKIKNGNLSYVRYEIPIQDRYRIDPDKNFAFQTLPNLKSLKRPEFKSHFHVLVNQNK